MPTVRSTLAELQQASDPQTKKTRAQLDTWVRQARGYAGIPENIVVWVAAEHPKAIAIANKWMKSRNATTTAAGWALYAGSRAQALDAEVLTG